MKWHKILPVYPAANIFPLMNDAELGELADDIKKHGLREKVDLYWDANSKPWLIDGRNRLDALMLLGRDLFDDKDRLRQELQSTPPPKLKTEADCVAYVISKNIQRRHLTSKQKRDLIAKLLKIKPDVSNRQVAKQVKADDKTVAKVRCDLERRAEIPHVETAKDSKGREQTIHKSKLVVAPPTQPATTDPPRPVRRWNRMDDNLIEIVGSRLRDLPKPKRIAEILKIITAAELEVRDLMVPKPRR